MIRFILLAAAACSVSSIAPAETSPNTDRVVGQFERFCLAAMPSLDDLVGSVGKAAEWNAIPAPEAGRLYKSDRNYAWQTEIEGQPYLLTISNRSDQKSFATICKLRSPATVEAKSLETAFASAAQRAGLKRGDALAPVFYQYSGRLSNGKRAHAKLSSGAVRRGFSVLSNNDLALEIIY